MRLLSPFALFWLIQSGLILPAFSQSSAAFRDSLTPPTPANWGTLDTEWIPGNESLDVRAGDEAIAILKDKTAGDFQLDLEIRAGGAGVHAGIIFRGQDLDEKAGGGNKGYHVGIQAGGNQVMWGALDPLTRDIASRPFPIDAGKWYHLRIQAAGEQIRIYVQDTPITADSWPVFDGIDSGFERGSIALRAAKGTASFRNLSITGYRPRTPSKSFTNPVQLGCADPVVLLHKGKYYAYTTHTGSSRGRDRGIRLHTSTNLVDWKDEGFALRDRDSWGDHGFWAPDIVEKDGTFYLYYAVNERMCVATAQTPMGPFRQQEKAPMQPDSIKIDGHIFEDDDGQRYFYYVSFGDGNEIWGGKLNDDMLTVDPKTLKRMVRPDQPWERHMAAVTEGPEMLKHQGTYYLTYSGSHFRAPEYAVGYATSDSPLGPWKKYEFNPVMKSTSYARGTAHHCFTTSPDGKETFIVYHRHHSYTQVSPRDLAIDRVRFAPNPKGGPDILQIHGPTSSPQPFPSGAR